MSALKRKTRLTNMILIGLGVTLFIFGAFTWQSFSSVSGILLSVLERQGATIPASVSVKFKQITLIYLLLTVIGSILAIVGIANEFGSFFEVN